VESSISQSATSSSRRALLIGADSNDKDRDGLTVAESLDELGQLVRAAGDTVVDRVTQKLEHAHPVTYLGKGKVQEVRELKGTLHLDTVVADDELSPTQQRNLEEDLDLEVVDRTAVILHIFARHARTREGRLQVELAQYRYRLPRLSGRGVELSRLGAGINTRGPGETKLETDRRRIRTRIAALTRELEDVRKQRGLHRRQRSEAGMPVLALAGYTNAGKSTLMNGLTLAGVVSSDVMFATLDPTTRQLELPNDLQVLLTDTVGFIEKLPTDLVAAFRATLEEIQDADAIVHVLDVSHPQAMAHSRAVEKELEDLHVADRPRLTVLNKIDLLPEERIPLMLRRFPNAVAASAAEGTGIEAVRNRMAELIGASYIPVKVTIPYASSESVNLFHRRGMIEREDHRSKGTVIVGRLPRALIPRFEKYM
jgi:GTPase